MKLLKFVPYFGSLYSFLFGKDYGYIGDCKEITNNILPDKDRYCEENSDGRVTNLSLYLINEIEKEKIDKIMSFDTIETLYISDDSEHSQGLPSNIGNLKNLKELTIWGIESFNEKDILNLPISIEKLSLGGAHLTQEDINGLEKLKNLQFLSLSDVEEGLDFKSVENLENLKELDINLYDKEKSTSLYYLKHFKNIETLFISKNKLSKKDLENIVLLQNLKELVNMHY
ncbi:hypothetical protein BCR32DRAFT_290416 [Anaeromyces robustus]|uniref:L domain-like protein n=1 Tax=Anaeromyces robustus TaxID=1754192 RepID=A0A1Y1XJA2_9FUNG|nr:hypothetical protein BCR32DRAFT_290416 [Anaeromyces robustus]|eukprot:ORX85840.1 hypothetical protein BCR32DRAFT_290416 [Anaeromyces robustus]